MTRPGPTRRLCPSRPPASPAGCHQKWLRRSFAQFLGLFLPFPHLFPGIILCFLAAFLIRLLVVGLYRISYEVLGPFPGGFSYFSSAFNL